MTGRASRTIAACAVGAATGVAGLAAVALLLVPGAAASLTVLGILVGPFGLAGCLLAARLLGRLQRWALARLAGTAIDTPPPRRGFSGWLTDRGSWRAVAYLVIRTPLTAIQAYVLAITACGLADLLFPLGWPLLGIHPAGPGHLPVEVLAPFPCPLTIATWPETFLASVAGAALLVGAALLARPAVAVDVRLARWLLGPAGSDRRLHELEQTRSIAVDEATDALRRIERNLHDGAQVRLTSLTMRLGLAREKASSDAPDLTALRTLLAAAQEDATGALADLRHLARGIHPPILDNGLPDALASLATTSAIPVELTANLTRRPSPAIEAIAYFCAAELVVNAAKHSFANEVTVDLRSTRFGAVNLTVTDDGVGGVDPARGSGLAGLERRVSTVDGQITVSSPPGGPTTVTVLLPMEA